MNRCLLVVGYNNVRIYDVAKLREIAAVEHGVKLVLVTENIKPQDHGAADALIACDLSESLVDSSLAHVLRELAMHALTPAGVLPFSDRGILLGAALATHFALPGISVKAARAGLDKRVLRRLEQARPQCPDAYRRVFSRQVDSLAHFRATVAELGGRAFVKPAQEGNSRGCSIISRLDECDGAWQTLAPYRDAGVIVEELIDGAREYSWDYVAGAHWITEKHTTAGEYRAEYQQIVPAPLGHDDERKIGEAGFHMRSLVSEHNGAFHNEVFLRKDGTTSAVETNMRPAGMHIWDLAKRAFDDFDPWRRWVDWAVTGAGEPTTARPTRSCYSGIRMIRADRHGQIAMLPDIEVLAHALGITIDESRYSKRVGDIVTAQPQDNSAFIGEIMIRNPDYPTLIEQLDRLARTIESAVCITGVEDARQPCDAMHRELELDVSR
ncbi:ATP-grasp domain-containing protein [Trinickia acidisoli]|uniref:ATP-grasp domain-containing protein n=1 Tax=Trinickia acidisoli TaxID=2767482 RepID=UPI001A8CF3F5|nr:hypothetical protein [Trinickia acidisoli]